LIVDREEASIHSLERLLRQATRADLRSTTDSAMAMALFADFRPDLVLVDLRMPHLDVFTVLEAIRGLVPPDTYLPIVALLDDASPATKQWVLLSGATDFLVKPFDAVEVRLRIANLLRTRALSQESDARTTTAHAHAPERGNAQIEGVERLAVAIEYREDGTGEHTKRVGTIAASLAQSLGADEAAVAEIRLAAPLHDVGKIAIPDRILLKPARLAPDEWQVMKTHTTVGARIVAGARHSVFLMAEAIALSHHERWDGRGYPRGLRGEAIPLAARIVAVADAFDAMTHPRPYRAALTEDRALSELERSSGSQFDPACVEHFLRIVWDRSARPE
jgi:putative two-component system response regulator